MSLFRPRYGRVVFRRDAPQQPRPIPANELTGVVSDDTIERMRERNAMRVMQAQAELGPRWLVHTPLNARQEAA